MRNISPKECSGCGSPDINEISIGHNGYMEIRCRKCGRHIFDFSTSTDIESDQDKLAQEWNDGKYDN